MRRSRRRDPIADAHQEVRDLRNQLHGLEQGIVGPLRSRIAELERDNAKLLAKLSEGETLGRLYRAAWAAEIRLLAGLIATGKGG